MKKLVPLISAVILACGMSETHAEGVNRIISFDGKSVNVITDDINAVLYAASYEENGELKTVERFVFDEMGEHDVRLKNEADKVMLWDEDMKPYDMKTPTAPQSNITLDRSTYSLYVGNSRIFDNWQTYGDYFTLNAEVLTDAYTDNDIEWSVSDESIIKVRSETGAAAEIQALRSGFADVYAALPDGSRARCRISVIDNYCRLTVQRIEFNIDDLTLAAGSTAQVIPIIYPKSVYDNGMLEETLAWSSSDNDVAEVSADGTVTAKADGTAVITAVSADVGREAAFSVTVTDSVSEGGIAADNSEVKNVKVGETIQLSASAGSDIVWRSENSLVADVDENGLVTAYSNSNKQAVTSDGAKVTEEAGTVKIYATAVEGGYTAEFDLCVSDADIEVQGVDIDAESLVIPAGETENITAVILPANILGQSVTWTSDDENVVKAAAADNTVYGANQAVLTAVGAGTAHITAS